MIIRGVRIQKGEGSEFPGKHMRRSRPSEWPDPSILTPEYFKR